MSKKSAIEVMVHSKQFRVLIGTQLWCIKVVLVLLEAQVHIKALLKLKCQVWLEHRRSKACF